MCSKLRWLPLCFVIALAGCRHSEFAPLSGHVTLDGKPLPDASITFINKSGGASGYGSVSTNGSYVAKTGSDTGLKPGAYEIIVVAYKPEVYTSRAEARQPVPTTPAKYANPATSGFKYTLTEAGGTYDLPLTSK